MKTKKSTLEIATLCYYSIEWRMYSLEVR